MEKYIYENSSNRIISGDWDVCAARQQVQQHNKTKYENRTYFGISITSHPSEVVITTSTVNKFTFKFIK